MSKLKLMVSVMSLLLLSSHELAASPKGDSSQDAMRVSRYVTLSPGASMAQRNPLQSVIPKIVFSPHVKTVFNAVESLLKDSGYQIAKYHPDRRVHQLFGLPLPDVHRMMGPMSLESALETLSGEPWILAVDPINRLITFQLPLSYKAPLVSVPVSVSRASHQIRAARIKPAVKAAASRTIPVVRKAPMVPVIRRVVKPRSSREQVASYKQGLSAVLGEINSSVLNKDTVLTLDMIPQELR